MGEVADDMLDGTCCQVCGEWHPDIMAMADDGCGDGSPVQWSPQGYPYTCPGCAKEQGISEGESWREEPVVHINPHQPRTIGCDQCERMFASEYALSDHQRDKH